MKFVKSTFLPAILILTFSISARAQKSIELKPIIVYAGKYIYDGEHADGRTLQVPLLGINNAEINHHYNNYKTFRRLALLSLAPIVIYSVGYLFTSANFNNVDNTSVQILAGFAFAGSVTFGSLSSSQLRKAVDIYNAEISPHSSIGIQLETLPGQQKMISAGFRFRF